jgi:hypothetical protein
MVRMPSIVSGESRLRGFQASEPNLALRPDFWICHCSRLCGGVSESSWFGDLDFAIDFRLFDQGMSSVSSASTGEMDVEGGSAAA